MNPISRRNFIQKTALGCGAASILAADTLNLMATPLNLPIGAQVWPLRSTLKDFPAFAKKIASIGVTKLELCSPIGYGEEFSSLSNAKEAKRIMADHGLVFLSGAAGDWTEITVVDANRGTAAARWVNSSMAEFGASAVTGYSCSP